jgi:hypothetical protein
MNGREAYEADCAARPAYHDGTPRRAWDQLGEAVQRNWDKNPTPRWPIGDDGYRVTGRTTP